MTHFLHQGQEQLDQMSDHEVQDVCTIILGNSQTILHMLVLRQKLNSLRSVLQRGVEVYTRNGYGATPLLTALQHNALFSAKVSVKALFNAARSCLREVCY